MSNVPIFFAVPTGDCDPIMHFFCDACDEHRFVVKEERWHAGCINKLLNCSGADLGDGKQLKQAYADNWVKRPRVPVPPKPPV